MRFDRRLMGAAILLTMIAPLSRGQERAELIPLSENDRNVTTGPAVGDRIPDFAAEDRSGKSRNFANLKGPRGLVFLIVRSADW